VEELERVLRGRRKPDRDQVNLFSDEPIVDAASDYFGFAAFAIALAGIIDNEKTATPLTIALSAPWGAGKTSVAGLIEQRLQKRVAARGGAQKRIVCWFNAWEHADAPHLGAALAAQVARTANKKRPIWWRIAKPLPAAMVDPRERGRRMLYLALAAAITAGAIVLFDPSRRLAENALDLKETFIGGLGLIGALWVAVLSWRVLFAAARDAARFIDDPGSEAARGTMAEVKKQLGDLIAQAIQVKRGGRLIIFVDDLERCRPARAVQVFEVASQLLGHRGVVTVLLADMHSLATAARVAYAGENGIVDPALGRRYLEKLVQLELDLPPPAAVDMERLLSEKQPVPAAAEEEDSEEGASPTGDSEPVLVGRLAGFAVGAGAGLIWGVLVGESFLGVVGLAIAIAGFANWIGAGGGQIFVIIERRRRRRVEMRVEKALEKQPELVDAEPGEVDELVRGWADNEKFDPLARQVFESFKTVKSEEVAEVEAFIKRFPPRFPRGGKRMLNHARLLTKIATERKMMGGRPELTPQHLGKWIVIGERWPDFAQRVVMNPSIILRAERGNEKSDPALEELLAEQPRLAGVIERLIYFQPAAPASEPDEPGVYPVAS
jgi:hypothetical protein